MQPNLHVFDIVICYNVQILTKYNGSHIAILKESLKQVSFCNLSKTILQYRSIWQNLYSCHN